MEAAAIGFDGVEFMEFAVAEQSGRRVSETLRTLGFHYAGRHRSKSADLFRQGQVNLILNSEQDSAAAEHFHFHGPSVCAMAFRVDNALRAVQRAVSLLCPERQEGVAQVSAESPPCVRRMARCSIWCNKPRTDDLRQRFSSGAGRAAGANADDGRSDRPSLPMGRMDHFVLFYRTMFGFQPQQLRETPDTMGIIQSRAMVS